jgi:hypothetical protein
MFSNARSVLPAEITSLWKFVAKMFELVDLAKLYVEF